MDEGRPCSLTIDEWRLEWPYWLWLYWLWPFWSPQRRTDILYAHGMAGTRRVFAFSVQFVVSRPVDGVVLDERGAQRNVDSGK